MTLTSCSRSSAVSPAPEKSVSTKEIEETVSQAHKQLDILAGKEISETANKLDGTKTFQWDLMPTEGDGTFVARCSSPKDLEIYISFHGMVESSSHRSAVRAKFD